MKPTAIERGTTTQSRGKTPTKPKQPAGCRSKTVTIPKEFDAFEKKIKKWISRCVLSRTKRGDGSPFKREEELVDENESLWQVWQRVNHIPGEKVQVFARYDWRQFAKGSWGVGGIRFYVSAMTDPVINTPPPPREVAIDELEEPVMEGSFQEVAKRYKRVLEKWVTAETSRPPGWARRMVCILKGFEDHGHNVDDLYVSKDIIIGNLKLITPDFPKSRKDIGRFSSTIRKELLIIADSSTLNSFISGLKRIDKKVTNGIDYLLEQQGFAGGGYATNKGMRYIMKFVSDQLSGRSSIYYCYKDY